MRTFRKIFVILTFLLAVFFFVLPCSALGAGTEALPEDEWNKFEASIPDDVRDKLTDGADSNAESFAQGVQEMSKAEYIIETVLEMLGIELGGAIKLFFCLLAILIISSIFS